MTKIRINIFFLISMILILGNIAYLYLSAQNFQSKNEQVESKIDNINNFWIDELKLKDSICFNLSMSKLKNRMSIDNDPETNLSLMVYVPDKACWECVKSKIGLINNKELEIPIQLFCSSRIKRRVILMLAQGEYEDIFRVIQDYLFKQICFILHLKVVKTFSFLSIFYQPTIFWKVFWTK